MAITLNIKDGFNVDYYWTDVVYNSYVGNTDKFTVQEEKSNLCYRFIASGGVPPYIYSLVGNTPSAIGLVNMPRTEYYDEYADLTLTETTTFSAADSGVKNVAVTCIDSSGESITTYGTITINKTLSYNLYILGTDTYGQFSSKKYYINKPISGLKDNSLYTYPGWYYKCISGQNVKVKFEIKGTPKDPKVKPKISAKKRPPFLTFEQPDRDTLLWLLSGTVEAKRTDTFYPLHFIMEDGPLANKDIYPMLDMMFFVPGDPNA